MGQDFGLKVILDRPGEEAGVKLPQNTGGYVWRIGGILQRVLRDQPAGSR